MISAHYKPLVRIKIASIVVDKREYLSHHEVLYLPISALRLDLSGFN